MQTEDSRVLDEAGTVGPDQILKEWLNESRIPFLRIALVHNVQTCSLEIDLSAAVLASLRSWLI